MGTTTSLTTAKGKRPVPIVTRAPIFDPKSFWHEDVYAKVSVKLPKKAAEKLGYTDTWPISHIMGEFMRIAQHSLHVDDPLVPRTIYGMTLRGLCDLEYYLYGAAAKRGSVKVRLGKQVRSRQDPRIPTLLVAVASYPKPMTQESADRRRWEQLVVDTCWARWGEKFASAIAHEDEGYYHLHLVVHNHGASVKPLHMLHAATEGKRGKVMGELYREAGTKAQRWFWENVGRHMAWPAPKPNPNARVSRGKANALRSAALQEEAERQAKVAAQLAEEAERLRREREEIAELRRRVLEELPAAQTIYDDDEPSSILDDWITPVDPPKPPPRPLVVAPEIPTPFKKWFGKR